MTIMTLPDTLTVLDQNHPVVAHELSVLRDKDTSSGLFRATAHRIGSLLMSEASRDLPLADIKINTPLCETSAQCLDPKIPILIVPILRAGLLLSDVAHQVLPTASVYHLGLYRNEETLQPVSYYNKLPDYLSQGRDYADCRVMLVDPMLATGGSAIAATQVLVDHGVTQEHITFSCLIAAPEGVKAYNDNFPNIRVITASLDEKLNEQGYIVPGLGDAGDRAFSTV